MIQRVCILDEKEERPIPPFLQNSFQNLGCQCKTLFLDQPRQTQVSLLEKFQPDLIVSIQNVAFMGASLLTHPPFDSIKKAVLFYDDPVGSVWLFGKNHPFISHTKECNVAFFIWDGYWMKQMQGYGKASVHPTHLSAEKEYFHPGMKDLIPGIKHCAVFLGNVPKRKTLDEIFGEMPSPYGKAARCVERKISEGRYGQNPYDLLEESIQEIDREDREIIQDDMGKYFAVSPDFSKSLAPHILLRRYAWLCGKRETRLRALRALARVTSVAILSNLKDEQHMDQDDFSTEIKPSKGNDLLFIDTSKVSYPQLGHLYSSGLFHFQSTDPQSVDGGIPYRVFQSAACAVPLITDYKIELADCFSPGKEMLFYREEEEIPEVVGEALKSPTRFRELGQMAFERFTREHTWDHRVEGILDRLSIQDFRRVQLRGKEE